MAMIAAKFAVVFDFPVPPRNECTETIVATHPSGTPVFAGFWLVTVPELRTGEQGLTQSCGFHIDFSAGS
jgi:hypothetical protein